MSVLTDSDWQAITPSGRSPERVKSELEQGTYVVLRDSPASPVFTMEQGNPLASSAFAGGISTQTVSQLTNRFQSSGPIGAAAPNNGNLDPAPPLDYIADTSQVKEAKEEPKPALISDNFGKAPPKLELQLCYDDSEKTYASDVPYSVIFSDPGKTVIKGVLNNQGWAMVEGGPNYPAKVIFGDEAEKAAAELALKDQYKQLDQALNDTAKQVADHVLAAKEKAKQTQLIEVTESFKLAVDDKIAALNAESEAFDNLSYLAQTWEIAKATKEGASNGFTEYIPDLGDFGKLMDAADIDITMLIEAISTGNIDALEAKLQQWKDRGGQGLNEARKTMETLILLLSDPTSREMLASVPKRIIAALPEDQVAELTAYQATQLGMDTAVVAGGTAVGTLAGGVGGPVAAGMLFTATTARKGGKALEGTINIVADISKSLKKINNQHDIVPYKKDNELSLSKGQPTKVIELEQGKKGSWNKELNGKLKANSKYKVGNYTYETDDLGRVKSVSGELDLTKQDRNTYQQGKAGKQDGIKDGLDDDEGGHIIASIFNGPGEQINYAAMDGNLNKGAWKRMENKWADALKGDPPKKVSVSIDAIYDEGSNRPEAFDITYLIDGKKKSVTLINQPGG
ncbi:DNA/RNA non-specific endonuclease [Shewanella nanhaiensis]|uniref:DNA/RNA non-specific endonuclease n=1 Tax=Shewanella nanhaiensis TaxID=2864872 RepID=A0ABS7E9D4_9GAMM|nr:DNA/RNA non-specific endonuclease [Shewanella nanhaiensis]MBW8186308.1 DNA/RNA non-specific endonuclease [Shewanella nanhaiensis]